MTGRVPVEPDLTLPGHPEVSIVGDLVALQQDGRPVPGVAPAAMQMGRHAAQNVLRTLRGEARRPFRYVDKGSLATIGRARAVGMIGRLQLHGFVAWLGWCFIHILYLIGFRNRYVVLSEWIFWYLTGRRGVRLIHRPLE